MRRIKIYAVLFLNTSQLENVDLKLETPKILIMLALLVIRVMQIQTAWRYNATPSEWLKQETDKINE